MADTHVKTVGDSIILGVFLKENGVGISGESPTVELRRDSDEFYFDWTGLTWVDLGGDKEKILTEAAWLPGQYRETWDQGSYDIGEQTYTAIYRNVGPAYPVLEIERFEFVSGPNVSLFTRKMLTNKHELERIDNVTYHLTVYDDDEATVIYETDITKSGDIETRLPV